VAHLRCDFFSDVLGLSTSMTVLLPQQTATQIGMAGHHGDRPSPVLYLLHGLSDDDTIWVRRTSIERYVAPLGLAVVMPQVHRSYYTDEAYGGRYWTFLSEELPQLVDSFFRTSAARQDTFVAGLSMGGYGAMKWALRQPDRFAAAASLSGVLEIARVNRVRPEDPRLFTRIFGDADVTGTPDDLGWLREQIEPDALPALWVGCGTEDPLYGQSVRFVDACARAAVPVTSSFVTGDHTWDVWDAQIQEVLAWLPLERVTAPAHG
jgi:putative tributyrin esterase